MKKIQNKSDTNMNMNSLSWILFNAYLLFICGIISLASSSVKTDLRGFCIISIPYIQLRVFFQHGRTGSFVCSFFLLLTANGHLWNIQFGIVDTMTIPEDHATSIDKVAAKDLLIQQKYGQMSKGLSSKTHVWRRKWRNLGKIVWNRSSK